MSNSSIIGKIKNKIVRDLINDPDVVAAIDCQIDGVEDNHKSNISNMKKQAILERCGVKVKRITYREWQYSSKACLDRVLTIDA